MNRNEANKAIPRINIRGKQYATVDARVAAFWELYPQGSITTQLVSDEGGRCLFKAEVWDGPTIVSTGHAFEVKDSSNINKTSYIENCETSAVGRALGFLGIGSNGSIASADEVANAIEQQKSQDKAEAKPDKNPKKKKPVEFEDTYLFKECVSLGVKADGMQKWYRAQPFKDKTINQLTDAEQKQVQTYLQDVRESIIEVTKK